MKKTHLINTILIAVLALSGCAMQSPEAAEILNIVVYGASGRVGEVIVEVALERGHKVTGISRNPEKLQFKNRNFTAARGDLMDINSIREFARDADAIVISVSARASDNRPENSLIVEATRNVQEALGQLKNKPYIVQIGSANLMYGSTFAEVSKNMKKVHFPYEEGTAMHAVLFGHQLSLQSYQASTLAWTILAPPLRILGIYEVKDKTTTRETYQTSTSGPVIAADGSKSIYVRDLAGATVNEIENRNFVRQVFTVGY